MGRNLVTCLVVLLLGEPSYADDKTAEQTKAAKEFTFEGVNFSTTLGKFKELFPGAKKYDEQTDTKVGTAAFITPVKAASILHCYFFKDNMHGMRIIYYAEKVNKIGGPFVILDRLKEKFGEADADRTVRVGPPLLIKVRWTMKDAKRFISVYVDERLTQVDIIDTEVHDKIREAQKKATEVGF
jgi:hypothetical protein